MVGWLGGPAVFLLHCLYRLRLRQDSPNVAFEADGRWQFALALLEKMRRRNFPNKLQLEKVLRCFKSS